VPPLVEEGALRPSRDQAGTLVLLRHGETDWNLSGHAQGHADVPLNATGHAQAQAAARVLAGFGPVRLWSSDLMRALQTAEHVASATGLVVEKDARLREYDVGERSGLTMAEFAAEFPERHASWLEDSERRLVPGEETTAEVRARVVPALRDCLGSLEPGETGVAVLHGACLKVGLLALLGWPWELSRSLQVLGNCGYCVLTESDQRGLRLASYNERAVSPRGALDFVPDGPVG
jgi:broad specificity phosphatase PhoE